MKNQLEIPIGVKAEIHGKKVVCVENETGMPCDRCAFETCLSGQECAKIACAEYERADEKYIIFKELKE